jgi:hypothetical protein
MRSAFQFLILLVCLPVFATAASEGYSRAFFYLNLHHINPVKYEAPAHVPGRTVVLLSCPFASPVFDHPDAVTPLKGHVIEKVQLVYTTYRQDESFSQQKLNQQRLRNLEQLLPDAFASPLTEWELVGQTGATTPEEGRNYFHGFVITYRIAPSPTSMKEEIKTLDSAFSGLLKVRKPGDTSFSGGAFPGEGTPPELGILRMPDGTGIVLRKDIPEDSLRFYLRASTPGASIGTAKYADSSHSTIIVTEYFEGHRIKREWKLEEHKADPGGFDFLGKKYLNNPDSVVMTVFRRNTWTNFVMVCDVTGSMSPYTAQIFAVLPGVVENRRCKGFLFFNDGDKKTTQEKKDLKAGGLYWTRAMRFDSAYYTAKKCMNNGDGGDLPENNVEALITAEKINPGGELVLIADNWASPRDLSECDKIKSPVHVVLCSARSGVNPDYLFLARVTNGSVHTRDQDVTNLGAMQEGEQVKIGIQTFLLHNDHFIPMENFSRDF